MKLNDYLGKHPIICIHTFTSVELQVNSFLRHLGLKCIVSAEKKCCHSNKKRPEKDQYVEPFIKSSKTRRSCDHKFDYQSYCLFCGTNAKVKHRKRGKDIFHINTLPILKSLKDICKSRNDEWGDTVLGRIDFAQDLPAVEARYHQT